MKIWRVKNFETNLPNLPQYPPLILRLLALRGLVSEEQIEEFLNLDYDKLLDPFLFKDMRKAVDRIQKAIAAGEKITIYADYDADAITAASVMFWSLKKLGLTCDCYIPDRFSEGYGVNSDAIKQIAEQGCKLIITVDCGANSIAEAELCRSLGVDLIITDHHEIIGNLPDAFALINPKNPSDHYPFPFLTGVGVAYKLACALGLNGYEKWLLDLVAIGTVADLQSLTGENRILVGFGLQVLAKTKNLGLQALLTMAALKNNSFDTFTLGFILAPRINAAGRLAHGNVAYELLTCDDPAIAAKLTQELNDLNTRRQLLTEQILSEAKAQVEINSDKKVLLAHGADWPKGVVGLVAGKLAEEYNRPALAISSSEGIGTGSARSIPSFNMVEALGQAKDLLHKYGGHTQAAGFTLPVGNLADFHQRLLAYAESSNLDLDESVLSVDSEVQVTDLNWENYGYIERLAPFGYGNPKPRFVAYNLEVTDWQLVGNAKTHLKIKLRFGDKIFGGIAFGQGFLQHKLSVGQKVDCAFELTSNEWNGNKNLELKILDLKIHD